MPTSAPTLYEDWRNRRERLGEGDVPAQEWERALQVRILDYLLKRYAADPVAQLAARFPVSAEVFLNRRALLVHRHLSLRPKVVVQDAAQANQRISSVLQRMRSRGANESVGAPAKGAVLGSNENRPTVGEFLRGQAEAYRRTVKDHSPKIVCETEGYDDPNDFYRLRLMSNERYERIFAARELATTGTLDDVNLFLELIALPPDEEMAQKLSPVIERPSESDGAPVLPEDPPEPPKKPTLTPEELEFYRDELMDNFADVTSIVNLLNDTGPPVMPLPCTEEDAGVPLPPSPVKSVECEPEMLDERKVLEECAMRLAQKEHRTS